MDSGDGDSQVRLDITLSTPCNGFYHTSDGVTPCLTNFQLHVMDSHGEDKRRHVVYEGLSTPCNGFLIEGFITWVGGALGSFNSM